jgi:DNA-binding response OmpR family regulator
VVSRTLVGDVVAQPKLLLVDDEVRWATRFAAALAKTALDVKTCNDGPTAIEALRNWPADVVLLDERMPGMSGHEVCRRLRAGGYSGAILIYSAYDTLSDLVLAHEAGADDHVSKAADLVVLQAKIRRAVERVRERRGPPSSRRGRPSGIRDLLRDLERGQAIDWGSLTQLEERLLCMLVCARGKPVSAEALVLEGWDRADLPLSKLYEPISNLREKLAPLGWRIQNVRGRGYRLERGEKGADES